MEPNQYCVTNCESLVQTSRRENALHQVTSTCRCLDPEEPTVAQGRKRELEYDLCFVFSASWSVASSDGAAVGGHASDRSGVCLFHQKAGKYKSIFHLFNEKLI